MKFVKWSKASVRLLNIAYFNQIMNRTTVHIWVLAYFFKSVCIYSCLVLLRSVLGLCCFFLTFASKKNIVLKSTSDFLKAPKEAVLSTELEQRIANFFSEMFSPTCATLKVLLQLFHRNFFTAYEYICANEPVHARKCGILLNIFLKIGYMHLKCK